MAVNWLTEEIFPIWNGPLPDAAPVPPQQRLTVANDQFGQFAGLAVAGVAMPMIYVFRPEKPNGTGVVIMPSGGYVLLGMQGEPIELAHQLAAEGTTCFILLYRLPSEGWSNQANVPLQDAQRAIRFIRALSGHFAIDPNRLGVVGFSAGAHLAATLASRFDEVCYPHTDPVDTLSARPSFAGLLYPVISMRPPLVDVGFNRSLFGTDTPDPALLDARSPSRCITAQTVPCFITHALDDHVVPVEHSLEMLAALRAHNIPVTAHFFQFGGHGFHITLPRCYPAAHWPVLFRSWFMGMVGLPE